MGSSPDFFCDLLNELELCPLLVFRKLITDLTGSESALRAQVESVERYILSSLTDPVDNRLLILKLRRLSSDKTENYLLVGRELLKRKEASGTLVVVLKEECINIFASENLVSNTVISAARKELGKILIIHYLP